MKKKLTGHRHLSESFVGACTVADLKLLQAFALTKRFKTRCLDGDGGAKCFKTKCLEGGPPPKHFVLKTFGAPAPLQTPCFKTFGERKAMQRLEVTGSKNLLGTL